MVKSPLVAFANKEELPFIANRDLDLDQSAKGAELPIVAG